MNNQLLSFSLLTAALGMGVVFLFLGILSVLMATIQRVFGGTDASAAVSGGGATSKSPDGRPAPGGASEAGAREAGAAAEGAHGLPDWVIAAAVACVLEEENEFRRSAAPWQPEPGRGNDAWMLPGKTRVRV